MSNKFPYIFTLFNALSAQLAQADPIDESLVLDQVLVSDKKVVSDNITKYEIPAESILEKQGQIQDTAKLLEDTPGINLQSGGGVSSIPVLHGLSDDRVKIDINGMTIPSACANHMNPPLASIDRTNIKSIVVHQGVAPVSAGGDSIGGSIIVKSADPKFADADHAYIVDGKLSSFYRSNGDAFGGSLGAGIANQNVRLEYTGSHSESTNYYDGNGQLVKSSAYEYQNHAALLAFKLDNHLLEIRGGQQHIPFQGFPTARMDLSNNDSIFGNVHYKSDWSWGKLESMLFLENTSHSMDFGDDKFNGPGSTMMYVHMPNMPMETRGRNFGYKLEGEILLNKRDIIRVGNEFHSNTTNDFWPAINWPGPMMAPNTFLNLNNATRDRLGTYAEWEAFWNTEWKSLIGIRYDHTMTDTGNVQGYSYVYQNDADLFNAQDHAKQYDTFDVTALLEFNPDSLSQYQFGYARKNRMPSLYELYPWSTNSMIMTMVGTYGDGNGYTGNLQLKPETAHNISFSASYHDPRENSWEIKATPYFSYIENFIDADRCGSSGTTCGNVQQPTTGFYYLQNQNHDARLWGADVNARTDLIKDLNYGEFGAHTAMNYVRGERMDGGNLYHMMPFNLKLGLDHKLEGWRNMLEMQFVDSKTDVQQIRNELTTPSYILLNAKTGYSWKNMTIDLGLDNVLDKQYYHPLGGAYTGYYYAMTLSGSQPNIRNLPGMGRSLFVGFTLKY